MKATLDLDDELIQTAREFTGIEEKSALIHEALRALIRVAASGRLASIGGSQPDFEPAPRRKYSDSE
jgi:Arc/MetJ family transcription regulator